MVIRVLATVIGFLQITLGSGPLWADEKMDHFLAGLKSMDSSESLAALRSVKGLPEQKLKYYVDQFNRTSDLDKIFQELTRDGYRNSITRAMNSVSTRHQAILCYRESSPASESFQQVGFATKERDVHNKSSILEGIDGMVPIAPEGGKVGTKLRGMWKECGLDLNKCPQRSEEYRALKEQLAIEKKAIQDLLNSKKYGAVERTRTRNGIKQVVVYKQDLKATELMTEWVPETAAGGKTRAYVLAAKVGGVLRPVVADTDMVMIAPKLPIAGSNTVSWDNLYGFETEFERKVRKAINEAWSQETNLHNSIINHGSEHNYGFNPVDDVYVCHLPGAIKPIEFDLRKANADREKALKAYGCFLSGKASQFDIHLPNPESLDKSAKLLGMKVTYDAKNALSDYQKIRVEGTQCAVSP